MLAAVVVMVGPSRAAATPADDVAAALGVRSLDGSGNNLAASRVGPGRHAVPAGRARGLRRRRRRARRRAADALRQQPDLQRQRPEPVLRERRHAVGLGLGPVPRPHVRAARRRPAASARRSPSTPHDPLEPFRNDFGAIAFERTPAAPGTGTAASPRQQLNTVVEPTSTARPSTATRPAARVAARGSGRRRPHQQRRAAAAAGRPPATRAPLAATLPRRPRWTLQGALAASPETRVVAGDVRANENIALTATHTLFAREHNRIVGALPASLSEEQKFEIARRVVGAEQQYITYNEFLPALGVRLPAYRGYDASVNADAQQRVRRRRLPRAQHDPRRVRAGGAGRHLHAGRARGVRGRRHRGRARGRRDRARRSRSTSPSATRTCSRASGSVPC